MTKMTPSQRKAAIRILRFYKGRAHNESVRITFHETDYGPIWVNIDTRYNSGNVVTRVYCDSSAMFQVTARGKVTCWSARTGVSDETFQAEHQAHICRMLRCTNRKGVRK